MVAVTVSWRQYATLVGICWLSGILVGTTFYCATEPEMPWLYLPLALPMASAIAFPFAAIAGLLAGILLIILTTYSSRTTSLATWVVLGTLLGAVVGAFHPLLILAAIVTHLPGTTFSPLPLAPVVVLPGAVAGALVGLWWYSVSIHRASAGVE